MALARLVVFATDYWRGDYDSDQLTIPPSLKPPKKHAPQPMKEAWNEHEEAVRIANAILSYNGLYPLKPIQKFTGDGDEPLGWSIDESASVLAQNGSGIPWFEVGDDYIDIPRFPAI